MPTDSAALMSLSDKITALIKSLDGDDVKAKEQHKQIVVAAEQLAIAAREPDENVYHIGTQIAHNAALRTVIAMGVFDEMPTDGTPITTTELASRLNVNEELLDRFLRALTSTHLFRNPAPKQYAHTPLSLHYRTPSFCAMTAQMYDFTCKGVFALPSFLADNKFTSAGTYASGAFQLGANTELGFWEYLNEVPSRMELFSAGMRAKTTIGSGRASGAFPFSELVCAEGDIAIVDVGGGRGQALEAIRQDWPGLKGRFILQDLPHVVEDGLTKGLPSWMETSKASFFEPQVLPGAHVYYFRRIFHDWDQERGNVILLNTKSAMKQHSRILIADMALPDVDAPRDMALQDLNMMSFGGMERSEAQWRDLVEGAGLVLRHIWKSEHGAKHAVIEAGLPALAGDVNGAKV